MGDKTFHIGTINGDLCLNKFVYNADPRCHREAEADIVQPVEAEAEEGEQPVPEALRGEQAKRIMERLVEAGLLSQAWQPVGLSRPQAAIVADCVAEQLQIRNKWKTFEQLWHRNNLRNDYNTALSECAYYDDFRKKVMRIIR